MWRAVRMALVVAATCAAPAWAGIGSVSLIDASGLEFLINTDVTSATSSNASGAAFDATYTGAVTATTSAGGTTLAVLGDAFNGYNSLFVDGESYNMNGPASIKCTGRQVQFAPQTIGDLSVQRKVYVPDDDSFCRWLNIVKNTGASTATVTLLIVNNLGSGAKTEIAASSEPPLVVTAADQWVVSFEDYTGGVSLDPRLGHVFYGLNGKAGLSNATFVTGNGQPFWEYELDIAAGQTAIVMSFVTGQPSIDAAIAKCEEVALVPETALACLSDTELGQIVNFDVTSPTCTLASSATNPTNLASIPVTVTFSEPVTGFVKTDIVPTNATVKNFDGSGASYSFNLVPIASGTVKADIAAGVAEDAGGNLNLKATTLTRSVDISGPTVTMTSTTPNPSNISTVINITVTFSEPVTDFTSSDISLLHATLEHFGSATKAYTQYNVKILPARVSGDVGADIAAGVAKDDAGNLNTAAAPFRHTVGPGFSCIGAPMSKDAPIQSGLAEIAPLAFVVAALGSATLRRKRKP